MTNVYVEPRPKAKEAGAPIDHYVLEHAAGHKVTEKLYKTQKEAIDDAKKLGHKPLVAHVRNTNKGNPDHWRSA